MAPLALPFRPPASAEGFISCRRGKEIEWKNAGQSPPGRRGRGRGYPASEGPGDAGTAPAVPGWGWWSRPGRVRVSVSIPPSPPCAGGAAPLWDRRFYSKVILEWSVLLYNNAAVVIFPFPWNLKDLLSAPLPLRTRSISFFHIQAFPLEFPASHPTNLPGLLTGPSSHIVPTNCVLFSPDTAPELPELGPMCQPFQRGFSQISPNSQAEHPGEWGRKWDRFPWEKMLSPRVSLPPGVWMLQFSRCSAPLFPAFPPFFLHFNKHLYKPCNWNSLFLCVWLLSLPWDRCFRVRALPRPLPMLLLGDLGEDWVSSKVLYLGNYRYPEPCKVHPSGAASCSRAWCPSWERSRLSPWLFQEPAALWLWLRGSEWSCGPAGLCL